MINLAGKDKDADAIVRKEPVNITKFLSKKYGGKWKYYVKTVCDMLPGPALALVTKIVGIPRMEFQ